MTEADGIRERAEQRFGQLRRQARESVTSGIAGATGMPGAMGTPGVSAPPGWCISTVARLVTQDTPAITRIHEIQSLLSSVGDLHLYPRESLHISLLGCTQREEDRQSAQGKRVDDIAQALARAAAGVGPVRVTLGGLNLIGPQFFIEILTADLAWKSLRERLAAELILIGENPMTHADPEPMHLNIARILRLTNPGELRRLLAEGCPTVDADLDLTAIELVVTDFVLTPATLTVPHTAYLGSS